VKTIKDMLVAMREELVNDIARRSRETAGTPPQQDIGDIYDAVSEERSRELDLILNDHQKKTIDQIDEALERIGEGTYGDCEDCGIKIPKGRLKIRPFAKLCVECQEKAEREEKYAREEVEGTFGKAPSGAAEPEE
jgi:DnaK suppressor protein